MSNVASIGGNSKENQPTTVPSPNEMQVTPSDETNMRSLIRIAIKGRRHIVAARMAKILGCDVTPAKLAEFCRNGSDRRRRHTRFPLEWLKAFCQAVENDSLARAALPRHLSEALAAVESVLESKRPLQRALAQLDALTEPKAQTKAKRTRS